jgi:hypothetical protein
LGDCGGVVNPDGGGQQAPFISAPALVWHDGAHNGHTDVQAFESAGGHAGRLLSIWDADELFPPSSPTAFSLLSTPSAAAGR